MLLYFGKINIQLCLFFKTETIYLLICFIYSPIICQNRLAISLQTELVIQTNLHKNTQKTPKNPVLTTS